MTGNSEQQLGGRTEARLATVLRNEQAMLEHGNETRRGLRETEQRVDELKGMIVTLQETVANLQRQVAVLLARQGGGPTSGN